MVAPENPNPGNLKLRRIVLERFRGIESLELDFLDPRGNPSPVTVLGGPNGSGKTCVLEACVMALGRFDLVRRDWFRRTGFKIKPTLRELQEQYSGASIRAELEEEGQVRGRSIRGEDLAAKLMPGPGVPRRQRRATYFSSWRDPRLVGKVSIDLEPPADRRERQEDRLAQVKRYLVNTKAYSSMVSSSSAGSEEPSPGPGLYDALIQRLNDAWAQFRPNRREYFAADPAGGGPGGGFDVFLQDGAGRKVPLDWLSSGELQVFTFIGWMLISELTPHVFCIDEPELHLDPQWHPLAMRAFQAIAPQSQFIVTTHSPGLYQSVYSFQRKLLVPDDDPRAGMWRGDRPKAAEGPNVAPTPASAPDAGDEDHDWGATA